MRPENLKRHYIHRQCRVEVMKIYAQFPSENVKLTNIFSLTLKGFVFPLKGMLIYRFL